MVSFRRNPNLLQLTIYFNIYIPQVLKHGQLVLPFQDASDTQLMARTESATIATTEPFVKLEPFPPV